MTLLFCDGFDHYGTDVTNMEAGAWGEVDAGATKFEVSTENPRTGTHSLRRDNLLQTENVARRVLGGAKTTVGLGFAFDIDQLPSVNDTYCLCDFRDTANAVNLSVIVQSTGIIDIFKGARTGTSIVDSVTPVVLTGSYQHIEILVTFDNTNGAVEVRLNGVTVIAATSLDTVATSNSECSQIALLGGNNSGSAGAFNVTTFFDDVYCYDDSGSFNNTFLGDRRVFTLFPEADTSQADWSVSTGGNGFDTINEADPNDDTDYIFANPGISPNPVSEFEMEDLAVGVSSISAVVLVNRMRKTDAGTAFVQPSLVSAATEEQGVDQALSESYTYYHDVVEADPDTAAAFTRTAVNAAKLKLDRTT